MPVIADDVVLGVEVEFAVVNDPDAGVPYESAYPVVKSYPKNEVWEDKNHKGHGPLVQAIEEGTDGFIRVGYDATVAAEPDGFECYSQPGSFMDQLQAWTIFWESPVTNYMSVGVDGKTPHGNPKSCGMHVHVSGRKMNPITMANMIIFINNRANEAFLRHVAGRYDSHYCKIQDGLTYEKGLLLYHAADCTQKAWRKKKILKSHTESGGLIWGSMSATYCCENHRQYYILKNSGYLQRYVALNPLVEDGTGDCEFRMFETPTCKARFMVNIEFVHALVSYCHGIGPKESGFQDFCKWLMSGSRRIRYRNLFKWLREAGYVEGLIPRRKLSGVGTG